MSPNSTYASRSEAESTLNVTESPVGRPRICDRDSAGPYSEFLSRPPWPRATSSVHDTVEANTRTAVAKIRLNVLHCLIGNLQSTHSNSDPTAFPSLPQRGSCSTDRPKIASAYWLGMRPLDDDNCSLARSPRSAPGGRVLGQLRDGLKVLRTIIRPPLPASVKPNGARKRFQFETSDSENSASRSF